MHHDPTQTTDCIYVCAEHVNMSHTACMHLYTCASKGILLHIHTLMEEHQYYTYQFPITLIKYITTRLCSFINCLRPTLGVGSFSCTCPVWGSPAGGTTCWSLPSHTPPHRPAPGLPWSASVHLACAGQRGPPHGRWHFWCGHLSCPTLPVSRSQRHQPLDTPQGWATEGEEEVEREGSGEERGEMNVNS